MKDQKPWQELSCLLEKQNLCVLSSFTGTSPYSSLVGFAAEEDLSKIYFATTRATKKFRNITDTPAVSLLIDNRTNTEADFHKAVAVTVLGKAEICPAENLDSCSGIFLKKHPHLEDFINSPSCALMSIDVSVYYFVSRFQNVIELRID
ncbi:MAG: pyridoxamine 5'-phosphate oxidase family protein [Planctomycetota bacterium]|jgi:nitroimidazol reductase NimA-like FMN-containing flavoprotein (pyridoxamine 5'-phosphate oxidase superfamily)